MRCGTAGGKGETLSQEIEFLCGAIRLAIVLKDTRGGRVLCWLQHIASYVRAGDGFVSRARRRNCACHTLQQEQRLSLRHVEPDLHRLGGHLRLLVYLQKCLTDLDTVMY